MKDALFWTNQLRVMFEMHALCAIAHHGLPEGWKCIMQGVVALPEAGNSTTFTRDDESPMLRGPVQTWETHIALSA